MSPAFSYLASHVPVRKELKFRLEGNIGIVCNAQDFRINYLNETALAIFQSIDGKKTLSEIADYFLRNVDVEREIFEKDLIEIIRNFQWQKLITIKQKM
jgi:hypothetical protein